LAVGQHRLKPHQSLRADWRNTRQFFLILIKY
jgi:hypothetical protein